MSTQTELSDRLATLGKRIDESLDRLKLQNALYSEHGPTGEELKRRHEHIQETVTAEIADIEAHGRVVSALERSVLEWMEHIRFDR